MITIIAFKIQLPDNLQFLANIYVSFMATILAWLLIGIVLYFIFKRVAPLLAHWIPGEIDDIIIRIFARPVLWLTFVFGSLNSLNVLNLAPELVQLCRRIFNSLLVLIVSYLVWKLLHDVVFYYGREWVKKTESRLDDTLLPVVRLFGSIILIFVVMFVILAIWGVNIFSVLIGAGILSLILGLALQDTLKNMFGGISLLVDAPFATGDVIMLGGKEVFKVEAIGLRATQLYDLSKHASVYMPNGEITRSIITNITRPTIELRGAITIRVRSDSDLSRVRTVLEGVALGLPCVVGNIPEKISQMKEMMNELEDEEEKAKYFKAIEKLRRENQLDNQCLALVQTLLKMADRATQLEEGGYTDIELEELKHDHLQPLDNLVNSVVRYAQEWAEVPCPYLEGIFDEEIQQNRAMYQLRNRQLKEKWEKLKSTLLQHELGEEMRFDDEARETAHWIQQRYKSFWLPWKNPDVVVHTLERDGIEIGLHFFVDDVRLENNERKERVTTELAIAINRKLKREGIKLA